MLVEIGPFLDRSRSDLGPAKCDMILTVTVIEPR